MNQFLVNLFRLRQLKYVNRWVIFCLDLFLSWVASLFTLLLVKFVDEGLVVTPQFLLTLTLASTVASTIGFTVLKTYKNIIRHSAFTEVGRLGMASLLKTLLLAFFWSVWRTSSNPDYPAGRCIRFLCDLYPPLFFPGSDDCHLPLSGL